MSATILSIFGRFEPPAANPRNWTTQEVAELYRVCEHLGQAGLRVIVDTGLSDEDEPWAIFEQCETGDVVVHIARIDGELIIANGISGQVYRGTSFRALTDQMLADAPLALPRFGRDSNVVMHPRVVLTAFVAATVVLAELGRGTKTAEAGETGEKAAEAASDVSALDVLSRLLSRDQANLGGGGGHSGSTAVAIGLAAAAAYAAQIAADEIQILSQDGVDGSGWLSMLLSETAVADEIRDNALTNWGQQETALQSVSLEAKPPHKDTKSSVPDQDFEIAISLDAEGVIRPVSLRADADSEHGPDAANASFKTRESNEALVVLDQTAPQAPAAPRETVAPEKRQEASREDEQFKDIVTKVESALVTFETEKLELGGNQAFLASKGAIIISRARENDDTEDADEVNGEQSKTVKASENINDNDKDDASIQAETVSLVDAKDATPSAPVFDRDPEPSYKLVAGLGQSLNLNEGEDVVVYMGGQVEIFGFFFGEDRIAFIEDTRDPDWLEDVSIVGTDVILSGHDGGSITLRDAATTLA